MTAPRAGVVLDTPYGFQENADEISSRAIEYFRRHVGVEMSLASLGAEPDATMRATAMARLRSSSFVFCGPGSPSYALRTWRETEVPALLAAKLASGGLLTFASAAALTLGARSVPVYEIYKVGERPSWLAGLDLLGPLGLPVAVIPHYDNAEGGSHDTRYCYLGERRLAMLERELDEHEFVLGIDSHTALILDLRAGTAAIEGLGAVTVRVAGRSEVLPAGSSVAMTELPAIADRLRRARPSGRTGSGPTAEAAPSGDEVPSGSPLLGAVDELEARYEAAEAGADREAALSAVLELDELLASWSGDTDGSGDRERARDVFTRLVTRLARPGVLDVADGLPAPAIVELLVELRSAARRAGEWETADRIRSVLAESGVELRDETDGTTWRGVDR